MIDHADVVRSSHARPELFPQRTTDPLDDPERSAQHENGDTEVLQLRLVEKGCHLLPAL
jgi:hypothetical protein